VKIKLQVASRQLPILQQNRAMSETFNFQPLTFNYRPAFSLIEVLVVVSLLSLIVLALMAVFTSTQRAFRASITQTDVLEGGRATMELMAADLRTLTPSDVGNAVNFSVLTNQNNNYYPLIQNLPGSISGAQRVNLLNYFFMLSRQNTKWIGIGYVVDNASSGDLYPLYRFYGETNLQSNPNGLFNNFFQAVSTSQWGSMSHLMNGVVHLTARAYDTNGVWINNFPQVYTNNVEFFSSPPGYGEAQFYMTNNMVPAAVELELGVLEDRTLQRAESFPTTALQTNYLSDKSGNVHVFRQRVSIPNVDPTAYQ
jgi:type II secretory pathway pseudopilin PulG